MYLDHPMYNWYIPVVGIEDNNLTYSDWLLAHVKEQYVTPEETRLHAATQNYNNLCICKQTAAAYEML